MALLRLLALLAFAPSLFCAVSAHGGHDHDHGNVDSSDWATRHMASEHHISDFDPRTFFNLHDFDSDGFLEDGELRQLYGLWHESNENVTEYDADHGIDSVFEMFDIDEDGYISIDEFVQRHKEGKRLPDLGFGPGHHGDEDYEYEIHHFEDHHDDDSPDSEFHHPEDIRHFQRHKQMADEAKSQEVLDSLPIIEANIPGKFRMA